LSNDAAICKDSETLLDENILRRGSAIDSKDYVGDTPLVYAAAVGNVPVLNCLYPLYKINKDIC